MTMFEEIVEIADLYSSRFGSMPSRIYLGQKQVALLKESDSEKLRDAFEVIEVVDPDHIFVARVEQEVL